MNKLYYNACNIQQESKTEEGRYDVLVLELVVNCNKVVLAVMTHQCFIVFVNMPCISLYITRRAFARRRKSI